MVYRSSFSQHNSFVHCPLMWFNQKVLKIEVPSDYSHANAGKVVHTVLENYYSEAVKDMDKLKILFSEEWDKLLSTSFLNKSKDEYWIMCLNGIGLNRKTTTTEYKIFFDDVLAYLDGVEYEDNHIKEITDWKTSKRSSTNEEEYILQMKVYAWLAYRKFGKLPQKTTVYYLRNVNNPLEYIPTIEDMEETKKWYNDILAQMDTMMKTKVPPKRCCEDGLSCFQYCNYKDRCAQENNTIAWTLHLFGSYMFVEGEISPLLNKGLHKKFSYVLKNAKWIKRHNPQAVPIVDFWLEKRRLLPIGFIHSVQKTLRDYAEHVGKKEIIIIKDKRVFDESKIVMPEKLIDRKLRPYQVEAIETFLPKKIGMLELGTGSGKGSMIVEIIRRLNFKTLVVVNRVELLKQTRDEIKQLLGIEVGVIGEGESDIKNVTVSTIQSLTKDDKYKEYIKTIRVLIIDEAQYINSKSFWKLAKWAVNTEFRLSVSGTCRRTDGHDLYLSAVSGEILFKKPAEELIKEGYLVEPIIRFVNIEMSPEEVNKLEETTLTGLINEELKYHKLYEAFIMNNEKRNNIIAKLVDDNKDKKIIILTRLIEHGRMLAERFGCPFIYGDSSKEEREQVLQIFKEATSGVIVGSLEIFSTGINLPSLNLIISASAQKSDVKSIQSLGRLLRKFSGKDVCYLYDFYDSGRMFHNASRHRRNAFLKEGHNVEIL